MQRLVIRLAREFGVDIAQVLVCGSVRGIGTNRRIKRRAGFVILTAGRIQNRKIVVGFRQIGEIFSQLGKHHNRLSRLALLGQDHAFQEPHLCIARSLRKKCIGFCDCLRKLPGTEQFRHIR